MVKASPTCCQCCVSLPCHGGRVRASDAWREIWKALPPPDLKMSQAEAERDFLSALQRVTWRQECLIASLMLAHA